MQTQLLDTFLFGAGYISSRPPAGNEEGYMITGSRNLMIGGEGNLRPFNGLTSNGTGGRVMFQHSDGYCSLNDYNPGGGVITASGSLVTFINRVLLAIGQGEIYVNGTSISKTASNLLTLIPSVNGSYAGVTSYTAGLSQPSAPTVALRAPSGGSITGKLNGAYSVKINRIRAATGGISIASPASEIFVATVQSLRLTFPTAAAGQTHWGLYCTDHGLPDGPFNLLREIAISELTTVDGVPNSIEIEWKDADLTDELAPISDLPPPPGTHCLQLENYTLVGGCYPDTVQSVSNSFGGLVIAVSLANKPESYDPEDLLYLPAPLVHVLSRPSDSYGYFFCTDSAYLVQVSGGSPGCALSALWPDVGIAKPHNATLMYGQLYAYTAKRGAVRMSDGGQPDFGFAARVSEDMKNWDPVDVVVGGDPNSQTVTYTNGSTCLAYCVAYDVWCAPFTLSDFAAGSAVSCVTTGGQLKVTMNNAGTFTLYRYNVGSGSTFAAFTRWSNGGGAQYVKTITRVRVAAQHDNDTYPDATLSVYTNGSTVAPAATWTATVGNTPGQGNYKHLKAKRLDLRKVKSFSLSYSARSTGGDAQPVAIQVNGNVREMTE